MDQNKLYIDNWFKMPPKPNKTLAIKFAKKGDGKKYAEKSHKKTYKRKAKKRG